VHIVIPLKDPASGKSRLARSLAEPQRVRLILTMLEHVSSVARRSRGVEEVGILTPSAAHMPAGCTHLLDRGGDLNTALGAAARELRARGARCMLVLAADLPFVTSAEIETVIDCAPREMLVAAPDWRKVGTNALRLPLARMLATHFGGASLAAHAAAARAAHVAFEVIERPGLAGDIDEPEQLALLAGAGGEDYSFLHAADRAWP